MLRTFRFAICLDPEEPYILGRIAKTLVILRIGKNYQIQFIFRFCSVSEVGSFNVDVYY